MHARSVLTAVLLTIPMGFTSSAALAATTPQWMKVDAKDKTVQLKIDMGEPNKAGGFNFNGYAHGHMTVTVPEGWTVKVKADNVGNISHSLEIVPAQSKPPMQGIKPAFANADTSDLKTGIKPDHDGSFTFKADKAGQYWMMCGVPGHALGGMWDKVVISKSATAPSVSVAQMS
jgi:sulfocyanin